MIDILVDERKWVEWVEKYGWRNAVCKIQIWRNNLT
jgi:hypothetical protein